MVRKNRAGRADALEVFIAAYKQQSPDQEKLRGEVVFQAGVYRMGHWTLVKHFIPGVTDCLDNFGSVLPKHREPSSAGTRPTTICRSKRSRNCSRPSTP